MDTVMIFVQKLNKKTQSPLRGLNSSQGTLVEQAKTLHKKTRVKTTQWISESSK